MRQHKMTNHKAEMAIVNGQSPSSAQVSPSLKELPGPSAIPAPVLSSSSISVKTTSSQTVQVVKDTVTVNSVPSSSQFNSPTVTPPQSRNTATMIQTLSQAVVPTTGTASVNVTTSSVQGREGLNSVLANYVKTKALKTNHNQSPSTSLQSESMTTQILLPFTTPAASSGNQVTLSAPMSAPVKSIKAPMLQRQLMSPLKPLPNVLIKDATAAGLAAVINGTSSIAK